MERSIAHIESLDPAQLNSLDELDECATAASEQQWQAVGAAATAARSIFITMLFTGLDAGTLPRHCPRCSSADPSHTYPSTCVTPSSSPALTGRCGAAARAAGPGCKKGGAGAGGAGGAPTKAAMASITTSRPRVTGRHRVRGHQQPRPRSVEPTPAAPLRCHASTQHYCLRQPPPPPPPPALTQTSIRPRRLRLRPLRHHPRTPSRHRLSGPPASPL